MSPKELYLIKKIFEEKPVTIDKKLIENLKKSKNMEVIGALEELITDPNYYNKIVPSLDFNDYYPFLFNYYINCMQNSYYNSNWILSPYLAAYSLKDFIEHIWANNLDMSKKDKLKIINDIKNKLKYLAKRADNNFKLVLINGLLEHLFENQEIKFFFNDWTNDIVLKKYYDSALNKTKPIQF